MIIVFLLFVFFFFWKAPLNLYHTTAFLTFCNLLKQGLWRHVAWLSGHLYALLLHVLIKQKSASICKINIYGGGGGRGGGVNVKNTWKQSVLSARWWSILMLLASYIFIFKIPDYYSSTLKQVKGKNYQENCPVWYKYILSAIIR